MKFIVRIGLVLNICMSSVFASGCHFFGVAYICEDGWTKKIGGLHPAIVLHDSKVDGMITGYHYGVAMSNSTVRGIDAHIYGLAINDSNINGDLEGKIYGLVIVNSSTRDIAINNYRMVASGASLGDITHSGKKGLISITLRNQTVAGDIKFSHKEGLVCVDSTSTILGAVTNAQIVKNECEEGWEDRFLNIKE